MFQNNPKSLSRHYPTLTCDDAGEGAAHSDRGERGGGPAERRHDGGGAAEGRECGSMTAIAVVVRLHGRGVTHPGGVGPVVAQVGVARRDVAIVGPVLELRALVLFTPHATHCRACRRKERPMNDEWSYLLTKSVVWSHVSSEWHGIESACLHMLSHTFLETFYNGAVDQQELYSGSRITVKSSPDNCLKM